MKILTNVDVRQRLHDFEVKYGMTSVVFYDKYMNGDRLTDMGGMDKLKWSTYYENCELKW